MRAADTNVLVRLMVNDDSHQAEMVQHFFQNCAARSEPVFIPTLVICELVWVLDRTYKQSKPQILAALNHLLENSFLQFENENLLQRSVDRFRHGKASFPDYVIGAIAEDAGCRDTVSFDRDLKGSPGFTVL